MNEERDLIELYAQFELPSAIEEQYRKGFQPFGTRANAKFIFFAARVGLSNNDYDEYMSIKPQRQEGETDERLRKRTTFQRFLEKRKPYFYNYDMAYDLNAKKNKIAERKLKKQNAGTN